MAAVDQDTYKATAVHRACFATGCATIFIAIAKSILMTKNLQALLQTTVAALFGYLFADLVTGVYHWSVDNYGSAQAQFFGFQIELFRVHHRYPSNVTKYDVARAHHILAVAATVVVLPVTVASSDPVVLGFFGVLGGFTMFSLQFHAWAHTAKGKLPPAVAALQDAGVLLRPSWHAAHHRPPHNHRYCSVSGFCDPVLDKLRVFALAEVVLFHAVGVRPQWRGHSRPTADSGLRTTRTKGTEYN